MEKATGVDLEGVDPHIARHPVPEHVVVAAKAAFSKRARAREVAELVFDSRDERPSSGEPRRLRFERGSTVFEVRVTSRGDRQVLRAWASPVAQLAVETGGATDAEIPEGSSLGGALVFAATPGEALRLHALRADGPAAMLSDWFQV